MADLKDTKCLRRAIKRSRLKNQRSIFVVVGPRGLNQIPVLYKLVAQRKLNVLWCSEDSEDIRKIGWDTETDSYNVTHCCYSEIQTIQYEQFDFAVIRDMEDHIRPYDLASIVESIRGSGAIIFLFSKIKELEKFTSTQISDFTESRFWKRLCASFESCPCCLIMDDTLNVLESDKHKINIKDMELSNVDHLADREQHVESSNSENISNVLTSQCVTVDQTKFLVQVLDALKKRTMYSTVSASSPKGRGKSAVLGLAIAGSIAMDYSSIIVSSLNYNTIKIVYKHLLKGLTVLGYEEDKHYDIIQSVNPKFNNAILGLNIFKEHQQFINFIFPGDVDNKLENAQLVVIDEAAAIPLPLLKKLTGPYVVLMASTTEGCGASGKFLYKSMVEEIRRPTFNKNKISLQSMFPTSENNSLVTIELNEPIFYAAKDEAECWVNHSLCLESSMSAHLSCGLPHPDICRLFYVCRETLFSYEGYAEKFLQQLMSLLSCSKREISPDYLLKIADGSDYHIFCLLPPFDTSKKASHDILCVILVHIEKLVPLNIVDCGQLVSENLHGFFNDWKPLLEESEDDFLEIQGIHIIDIVTHPSVRHMGYGFRAVQLLQEFYEGKCVPLDDDPFIYSSKSKKSTSGDTQSVPPLLLQLTEVEPEKVEYILVSYYLTLQLLKFWKKSDFVPMFIFEEKNAAQEHMCLMMKTFGGEEISKYIDENWKWFSQYYMDDLSSHFKHFSSLLALAILLCKFNKQLPAEALTKETIDSYLQPQVMKKLENYCQNLTDLQRVRRCIPELSQLFFENRFIGVDITKVQQAILLSFGLQKKSIDEISKEMSLPPTQIHGLLNRVIRKLTKYLNDIIEKEVDKTIPVRDINMVPVLQSLDEELNEAAQIIKEKQADELERLKVMDFSEYAIKGSEDDWEKALHGGRKTLVSIKSLKKAPENVEFPARDKASHKPFKNKKNVKRKRRN